MQKPFRIQIFTVGLNQAQDFDTRLIDALKNADVIFMFPAGFELILQGIETFTGKIKPAGKLHGMRGLAKYMKDETAKSSIQALIVPDLPNMGRYVSGIIKTVIPDADVDIRHFSSRGILEDVIDKLEIEVGTTISVRDVSKMHRFESNPVHPDEATLFFSTGGMLSLKAYLESVGRFLPAEQILLQLIWKKELGWTRDELTLKAFLANQENLTLPIVCFPISNPSASLNAFAETIGRLRAPDGCPWDREQTHVTLRTNLLEETYEALVALDAGDMAHLREELGDVLLQIVLHAQIAFENNEFTLADVIEGINRKIVLRHPHVFGNLDLHDAKSVVQNWEKIKTHERENNGNSETQGMLTSVPRILPALSLAQKYQERAARVGFDWTDIKPVIKKIREELLEVQTAVDKTEKEEELGDLLFAVVNLARWLNVDAESALRAMTLRFKDRFEYIESCAKVQGRTLNEMTLKEMDALWDEAKARESD